MASGDRAFRLESQRAAQPDQGPGFERSLVEGKAHNVALALPEHFAGQAEEALKSSYNLEFPGIKRQIKERELEDQRIDRLRDFILKLGLRFLLVGRQHRLTLGRKEYFIDLLFHHRSVKALVATELKVGAFEPEYAGKTDFDLNLLNERERAPDDGLPSGSSCAQGRTTSRWSSHSGARPTPSGWPNTNSSASCRPK
ncbi:PDDEXK nuclease domain-containing protein [Variovorax sp. J22R133]|nr:PDDEXK nuclease domain-containing protein [Variovorax sp. J22R133]MDM0117278.1 PDDEXK nuclease domain-containing protein [Variovorax sp. J22R133]